MNQLMRKGPGISRSVALHYRVVPSIEKGGIITILSDRALSREQQAEIEQLSGTKVNVKVVDEASYQQKFNEAFGLGAEALSEEAISTRTPIETVTPDDVGTVKFVDELLNEAESRNASDVHIEPSIDGLRVRIRVDGLMRGVKAPEDLSSYGGKITARIKVLSALDPTPSAVPKEGKMRFRGRDLRVSVLPTPQGEALHLRFLTHGNNLPDLAGLGVSSLQEKMLLGTAKLRSGLLVSCGPTGSGKSTTLHVLIREGIPETQKVLTVEDPVEYELGGAVQVEVGPDLSFPDALKAILRHDPDVILIGEMRDPESAKIAVQATLTGHLVLTSLHANDEAQAITRLRNLGLKSALLAASLSVLVSQRLIRKLCPACRGRDMGNQTSSCPACRGAGYLGRIGLFRTTILQDDLSRSIELGASEEILREQIEKAAGASLRNQAEVMVRGGETTALEVARVFGE